MDTMTRPTTDCSGKSSSFVRAVRDFSLKVLIVTASFVLGIVCQQDVPPEAEAVVHMPAGQIVPAGFGTSELPGQSDPVVDEMPSTLVYT